jgi:putative intracellular protease/amidase
VTTASPLGGSAPVDEGSLSAGFVTSDVTRFKDTPTAMDRLIKTLPLGAVNDMSGFDAIVLVGGHGTMWDFAPNADLARLLDDAETRGAVISAVCHGVAGLLNATKSRSLQGRRVTRFSNEEETAVGLTDVVPFLLETRLRAAGAMVEIGPAFQPRVVVDGRLVTGQNPSSSHGVAQEVLELLRNRQ